ncbi:hypothetical protein DL98DRAFT_589317 [Cadophora sp. DSE1049]|nr:hypothetical protein DL98DRAFT_589317 [Cadophora sp. DSE1049]
MVPQVVMIGMAHVVPWMTATASFTKPPSILHACSESRGIALPEFEIAFTKNAPKGDGIYFNFSRDALAFEGYEALVDFFLDTNFYYHARIVYPSDRKIFALVVEEMPTSNRLNARSLRTLGRPSHIFLVRKQGVDIGMDTINAGWIQEFWTCSNGHIRNGDIYPCPEVLALTYEEMQTKLEKLSSRSSST